VISPSQTKYQLSELEDWFNSDLGRSLLKQEEFAFERMTSQVFGYQLLQLGLLDSQSPMLVNARIRDKTIISEHYVAQMHNFLVASSGALPILTDSIDAVLLPHTLDFCLDPQQVLREVERVLIPEGRIIISGFNPLSLWGLTRMIKRSKKQVPWNGHFVSYTRLYDWLSLLGFEIEETEVMMFKPPLNNISVMQKLNVMEKAGNRIWPRFAGVYMIKAVKRVSTMTPMRRIWKRRPRLLPQVVKTTSRGMNSDKAS